MDSNFNKIKKLMQGDNNQPLPPELDWSNMKDGIFDKMHSIEQEEFSGSNDKHSWKRIGLFLSLFFVLALGLISVFYNMKTDQYPESDDLVQSLETDPGTATDMDTRESGSSNLSKSAPTNQPVRSRDSLVGKNRENKLEGLLLVDQESESTQDPNTSEGVQMNVEHVLGHQQLYGNEPQNNPLNVDRIGATPSTVDTVQKVLSPLKETRLRNLMRYTPELQPIPAFGLDQMGLEIRNPSLLDIQNTDSVSRPATQRIRFRDQLILEGGITYWNEGYGNRLPDRAQYEAPIPSFQLQGYYLKGLKRNYFVMAGLQYQQLESKLSYDNTIENYKITFVDTILQVQNNLLTGEETIIRGDVEEFVKAERSVRHYNKTQLFKASLSVGNRWRFNSFQTDVYLGADLNSWVRNEGRMFSENTIIDYNGVSNSFFQNQWTVDGVLGLRLHYFLTPEIGLTTGFQTQKSLMNWSNQEGVNFYPASFGLQLGVSYAL